MRYRLRATRFPAFRQECRLSHDRIVRGALWTSVAVNALGVLVFLPPALGYPSSFLPIAVPRYFAAQIGYVIALFLVVYAWQARQATINRGVVLVGGAGKLGFFAVTAAYALAGDVPVRMAVQALPDLLLGAIFLWWVRAVD